MDQELNRKISAKINHSTSSRSLNDRVRDCVLAGDIDGALTLMNGMVTDKVTYMLRNTRMDMGLIEDCIQDTLIHIMRKWELVSKAEDPLAYAKKLSTFFVIDRIRKFNGVKEMPFPEIDPDSESSALLEFEQELLPSQESILMIAETQQIFNQALADVFEKSPDCKDNIGLYQEAQNNDEKFDAFCKRLGLEHQAMYARFRRCIDRIIDHHLYPKFWDLVARLYPNVLRKKQEARRPKGE